jgi:hypothetical protein
MRRDGSYWHLADNPAAPAFVRYWSNNGQKWILARDGLSANDPKRTSVEGGVFVEDHSLW